jgi:hypothetical protein
MEKEIISLEELTPEKVLKLSEEDVSKLLSKIVSDLPKEKAPGLCKHNQYCL